MSGQDNVFIDYKTIKVRVKSWSFIIMDGECWSVIVQLMAFYGHVLIENDRVRDSNVIRRECRTVIVLLE